MRKVPGIEKIHNGFSFLVNEQAFIMFAAEVHNSACTSRQYMQNVWRKVKELNCNTVLAPVYWEIIEPQEDHFDFTLVEQLILDAREQHVKLVLLWFGSWKNGLSTYAPAWVKTDLIRFPRTEDEHGVKTKILSMFDSGILPVELKCFNKLTEYVKELDAEEQTVIAIQIENEVGILGAARDFSPAAEEAYKESVPDALVNYLENAEDGILRNVIKERECIIEKTWETLFQQYADEAFMCWHYAGYINELAKCIKECYGLPVFTNVWLKEFRDEKPGFYPCGGPVPEMLDIWKCAAPNLDFIAPDIYTFQFEQTAASYTRKDNPLFVAETRRDKWAVANLYVAVGTYHTLCYSPFGAESIGEDKSFITQIIHTDAADKNVSSEMMKEYLALSYKMLGNMMPLITKCYGTDKMIGFAQTDIHMTKHIRLGKYQITVEFYHGIDDAGEFIPGAGIVIQQSENELLFIGYGYRAGLETGNTGMQLDYLSLEKGFYNEKAEWIRTMALNGDEQHIRMEEKPTILRAVYYEF